MRRVGVLLSGCGPYDGSDVEETVLLLLALRRKGFRPLFLAPDVAQADVVNHATGETEEAAPPRRALVEAARLARGVVHAVTEVAASELDALVIPGGMGAVRTLCEPGPGPLGGGPPRPEIASLLDAMSRRGAPVGAIGLARVVVSRHRGEALDPASLSADPREVVSQAEGAVLFTPGFMGCDSMTDVAQGIERMVDALAERLGVHGALRVRASGP